MSLDDGARAALLDYAFPGNVRELENLLERAVTLCSSGVISAGDLNLRASSPAEGDNPKDFTSTDLGNQVADVQRQAIVDALEKTRYNKTAAAKLLGLSFRQLALSHQEIEYRIGSIVGARPAGDVDIKPVLIDRRSLTIFVSL